MIIATDDVKGENYSSKFSVSKMAAKSGGQDEWPALLKPIIGTSRSLNKNDVLGLAKSILKR